MQISLPYGKAEILFDTASLPNVDIIKPDSIAGMADPLEEVRRSINEPISGMGIPEHNAAGTVAIAVNDKTRPVPHQWMLPPLLEALEAYGYTPDRIQLIVATGTHIPMHREEIEQLLPGNILNRYDVISHNSDCDENLVYCGETSYGTPVFSNRLFREADLRIVTGNIEPHHFAGFSGGAKSASIGLGGRKTIDHNHAMLADPRSTIAVYEDNPLRQDIEEIGALMGVDLALNVVMNSGKQIIRSFFGSPRDVMKAGIPVSRSACQTCVSQLYDLVIASVGGSPKDLNLYQSQKALSNAALLTRDGGTVILIAECNEGSGSASYVQFMQGLRDADEVIEKFKQTGFQVGPHKAFQIARELKRINIVLVSNMQPELVRSLILTPAPDLETAISIAKKQLPAAFSTAIMPKATNTIPMRQQ